MGFDAIFLGRIDKIEKNKRRTEKSLEYVHYPSKSEKEINIFEHILDDHYSCPKGCCLDDN